MCHQSPVRLRARSEYFYARAVRVQLHTRVFLKFKSSCTVVKYYKNEIETLYIRMYVKKTTYIIEATTLNCY